MGSLPVSGFAQLLADDVLSAVPSAAVTTTQAWPIPAHSMLHIAMEAAARPQQVSIVNLLGRVVLTQEVASAYLQLDVSTLPAASYVLGVRYAQQVYSSRSGLRK